MKKVYQSIEWKEHSARISRRRLKRKQENKSKRAKIASFAERPLYLPKRVTYADRVKKRRKVELKAPANFSIINNPDETLSFFRDYYRHVREDRRIFFDMSDVSQMTEDAILYMLSRFHYSEKAMGHDYVSGNVPQNLRCRELLMESGFYDHVNYSGRITTGENNIFKIETKVLVDGQVAKGVVDFVKGHLKANNIVSLRSIYPTLIECMANTRNHAYETGMEKFSKWWIVAMYGRETDSVHFTFLDNGLGIPATIRRTFIEKFTGIWGGRDDSELIASALMGEFRTQTKAKWRGKGLPRIRRYVESNEMERLTIISNNGYVYCDGNDTNTKELGKKFYGTLLSWDIPQLAENSFR